MQTFKCWSQTQSTLFNKWAEKTSQNEILNSYGRHGAGAEGLLVCFKEIKKKTFKTAKRCRECQ